ncbi:MAG: hypothetical protein K6T28_08375 [Acidothermus sp.]|nr:hypothetical protein [Acidothermus sp.]
MLVGVLEIVGALAGTVLGLPLVFLALMVALERFERWISVPTTAASPPSTPEPSRPERSPAVAAASPLRVPANP